MKKLITSAAVLAILVLAVFVSGCSSNMTVAKRYHSRGFNIAWGGGKVVEKQSTVKAKKQVANFVAKQQNAATKSAEVVALNEEVVVSASVNTETSVTGVAEKNTTATLVSKSVKAVKSTDISKKSVVVTAAKNNQIKKAASQQDGPGKSQIVALVLCILVGAMGIHRFYLGYYMEGVLMLLTGGGCLVWWIIDLVRIVTGDLQPVDGAYEETL